MGSTAVLSCTGTMNGSGRERSTNPYAVKKAAPGLFTKPLEDFDDFGDEEQTAECEYRKDESKHMEDENDVNVSKDASGQSSTINAQSALREPMSVSLPPWKRLPTRTVSSFGPSEILTVSEAFHSGQLYATKSIRTTGVLSHKICLPGTRNISLVLKDPLAKLSVSSAAPTTAKKGRRISFGSTPAAGAKPKGRPSLGMARNRTTPLTSRKSLFPSFKTPVVALKATPQTPSSLPFRTPALSSRKRPFASTARKLTPDEALTSALLHDNVLWILADPDHVPVNSLTVGDIVTVMGTVQVYDKEAPHQLPGRGLGKHPSVYVQARILRQDNGANLRLHQEALLLRRKHLLQSSYPKSQNEQPETVMLGCGPPPYNLSRRDPAVEENKTDEMVENNGHTT